MKRIANTESRKPRRGGSPSGSVLILVVALLVILSLIGISFLAAARTDRYSAQQNVTNTQIDMLVDGVVRMTESVIVDDLYGRSGGATFYRPLDEIGTDYEHYDAVGDTADSDGFLAERVPALNADGDIAWGFVSAPLAGDEFESPVDGDTYTQRADALPDNQSGYPALHVGGQTRVAADADGDGIADAGLWRLPMPQLDGVTYYAAVRIIDNSAAINVNTAWSRKSDFDAAGNAIANSASFPSNIGLLELLRSYDSSTGHSDEMASINTYRFGNLAHASLTPIKDDGNPSDFYFASQGDALFMQLGRRLDHPGINAMVGSTPRTYRPFGASDMLALAYRFCLVNPQTGASALETLCANAATSDSIYKSAASAPYGPADYEQWFDDNFDYDAASPRPIRALLTTRNPVSNLIRPRVLPTLATVQNGKVKNNSNSIDLMTPYGAVTCRTSLNTAGFGELWRAYFEVMCETSSIGGATVPAGTENTIYKSSLRDPGNTASTTTLEQLLLRSAQAAANTIDLRDSDTDVSSFDIQVELTGLTTPAKHGLITRVNGYEPQPFITEVYAQTNPNEGGNNKNPDGYFAIELHNPYTTAISLKGWRIYAIPRKAADFGDDKIGQRIKSVFTFGNSDSIPAGGYVVLENYDDPASGVVVLAAPGNGNGNGSGGSGDSPAKTRPPSAKFHPSGGSIYVEKLALARDREVIIVRPHAGNGQVNSGQEKRVEDFVPIDQFDFTGLPAPASNAAVNYHYRRAHGAGNEWKFIYPGQYSASASSKRHEGTYQSPTWNGTNPWNATNTPVYLGAAGPSSNSFADASYSNPVSLPMPMPGTVTNQFPFGGFGEVGDGLYVPFIGNNQVGARQDQGNEKLKYPIVLNSIAMDASYTLSGTGASASFMQDSVNGWAEDFFDYFTTIHNPGDDLLPNITADAYAGADPVAVSNSSSTANSDAEKNLPVHGSININTAPWKVLAALPMVDNDADNAALAKAIVAHRQTNGPFRNLFDLNDVLDPAGSGKGFQNRWNVSTPLTTPPQQTEMVRRTSNLIDTRSDAFTCYVLVQGWRNAGTPDAELVAQRRRAFIADRSGIISAGGSLSVINVPNE